MPKHKDESHDEELRSQDHELLNKTGSTFSSIQNLCSFSSSTGTVFGVSNISGIDFKSTPPAFYSCSSNGATSVIFGVPKAPAFTAGSGSSAFSTGITCAFPGTSSIIGRSDIYALQESTTPGFGIKSTAPSFSASDTSNIFRIPSFPGSQGAVNTEPTKCDIHLQGSGVASYSETREVNETGKNGSVEKTQPISATPVYSDKSQKKLRSDDYELRNKGGHTLLGGQSSAKADFKTCEPFKFDLFPLSPSPISFFPVNLNPSQPKAFKPASLMPTFNANPNSSSLIPSKEPINSCQSTLSPSTQFTSVSAFQPFKSNNLFAPPNNNTVSSSTSTFSPSHSPFSLAKQNPFPFNTKPNPFSFIFPNEPANSTFSSGKLSPTLNTSQPADKIDSHFTKNPSLPSQASNGLTMATEGGCQNINGQKYVLESAVGVLAPAPFPTRSEFGRPNTVLTSDQHGISSLPVPNKPRKKRKRKKRDKLSPNSGVSLLRTRHELSIHDSSPAQRYISPSSEPKVPIVDEREGPYVWVRNPLPLHPSSDGKSCEYKDLFATSNLHLNDETTSVIAKKHEADVLALMPKLPNGDEYYTEPSLNELAAKEMAEPGSLSRVNDFVVGRLGYGSVKFLGETDVRHLDLGPIVQFNNREVIVYEDDRTKPPVGQGVNKPAEITLLNVKCMSKRKRKHHTEGPLFESYKEMLIKKGLDQGAEFVSYDPVRGEWKFRVQQF